MAITHTHLLTEETPTPHGSCSMPEKGAPAPDTAVVFSADNLLPQIPAPPRMKTVMFTQITGLTQDPWTDGGGGLVGSHHKTQMFCPVLKCDSQWAGSNTVLSTQVLSSQSQCCLVPFLNPSCPRLVYCIKILFGAMREGGGGLLCSLHLDPLRGKGEPNSSAAAAREPCSRRSCFLWLFLPIVLPQWASRQTGSLS